VSTGVGEDDTDLLKVPQVAKRLGVSEPTVWRLIGGGELESVVVGARSRRVSPAAIDAYLARKTDTGSFPALGAA